MVTSTTDDLSIGDETSALQSEPMSDDKIILEKLQQIKRVKLIAKAREKKSDLKALKHENWFLLHSFLLTKGLENTDQKTYPEKRVNANYFWLGTTFENLIYRIL